MARIPSSYGGEAHGAGENTARWHDRGVALAMIPVPEVHLVFLDPNRETVAAREANRPKNAYGDRWTIEGLQAELRTETDRLGLWLDSSDLTADQTVDRILRDLSPSLVRLDRLLPPRPPGQS
jgi:hypothetical protein